MEVLPSHRRCQNSHLQASIVTAIAIILLFYHWDGFNNANKINQPGREILRDKMTLAQFNVRTNKLKKQVDTIAEKMSDISDEEKLESVSVKHSNTIVYNRIDKAGSTTLISKDE